MPATAAWLASIEAVLNRSLEASAQAQGQARQLEGTSLDVAVSGFQRVRVAAGGARLALLAGGEGAPNATLTGSPLALLRLFRAGASARSAAGDQRLSVAIEGDAEVADRYRRLLELARPDIEEELSRWIGDFPARQLSKLARSALDWMRRAGGAARDNIAEYLQEEGRDLVNRTELEEFLRGVDNVREAADRIEARLVRLEARAAGAA
jgi:ubiquinone biosynthesis accessory factor UbiJ